MNLLLIIRLFMVWIIDAILRFPTQMYFAQLQTLKFSCNSAQFLAMEFRLETLSDSRLLPNVFIVYLKIWKESLLKEQLISWWTADANFMMELLGTMAGHPTFEKTLFIVVCTFNHKKNDSKGLDFKWHVGGGGQPDNIQILS